MKTSDKSSLHLFRQICSAAVTAAIVLGAAELGTAAVITGVVETGGDNEATDTIPAKWTGQTFPVSVVNEPVPGAVVGASYTVGPFRVAAPAYVDRNHAWTNASGTILTPSYLLDGDYIMIGNDNRDNVGLRLDVTVNSSVRVYLLIDNRLGDAANGDPPGFSATNMQWVVDEGWTPVITGVNHVNNPTYPDDIGIDEGADGSIQQWHSIYSKLFPAGTFQLKQADNAGRNMYGVVVKSVFAPPTPTGLVAFAYDGQVRLFWEPTPGATRYDLLRAEVSGGPYSLLASPTSTNYTDLAVNNGTTYYYAVAAANEVGSSSRSAEVSATPQAAPSNVIAVGGTNQVTVTWTGLANAESYTVKRATVSGGLYADVATGVTATEYLDTTAQAGRTYYYVVQATLTGGGLSGMSFEASAVTAPSAPTLTAAPWAATVIQLRWAHANAVLTQFILQRSTDGANFTDLAVIPVGSSSYYDQGLAASTTYFYRIQAQNSSGLSDYSNVASNTTPSGGWNVNFANAVNGQPANDPAPTPAGYVQDVGNVFGDRGNGLYYGWNRDITVDGRWRKNPISPDLRYDTFMHLIKATPPAFWEIEIPNGFYQVRIVAGESDNVNSVYQFDVEGSVTPAFIPSTGNNWVSFTNAAIVSDGRLTISSGPNSQTTADNNKIAFIDVYPAVPTLPVIGTQPQSQTVEENRPANFSVVVANASDVVVQPLFYQWYGKGVEVGANSPTLTLPLAQLTDAGESYVVITNYAGSVTSSPAQLAVNEDLAAPQPLSVGSVDGFKIGVCFDEILDTNAPMPTAIDNANYFVNGAAVSVVGAVFRPDARSVELTLEAAIAGSFTVQIENVQDLAENGLPSAVTLTGEVFGQAQDLGYPLAAGSHYACASNSMELVGGGTDLWGTYDEGHFAFKMVTGNFDARVRVDSLTLAAVTSGGDIAKAGLMARPFVESNSPTLHLLANPPPPGRNQLEAGVRTTVNGATASWGSTLAGVGTSNLWLRLTRSGNSFVGYWSSNGLAWDQFASTTLALDAALAVGPVVCAHTNFTGLLVTGAFSNFKLAGLCAGTPPVLTNLSYTAGPPAQFSFQFASESGCTYLVEYKDNLEATSWTLLTTLPGTGGLITVPDSGDKTNRFYQVRLP